MPGSACGELPGAPAGSSCPGAASGGVFLRAARLFAAFFLLREENEAKKGRFFEKRQNKSRKCC